MASTQTNIPISFHPNFRQPSHNTLKLQHPNQYMYMSFTCVCTICARCTCPRATQYIHSLIYIGEGGLFVHCGNPLICITNTSIRGNILYRLWHKYHSNHCVHIKITSKNILSDTEDRR